MKDSVNERLKVLISALNLNVASFADALGVKDSTIRNYFEEGRRSKPGYDFFERLTHSFGTVNLYWLFGREGDPLLPTHPEANESNASYAKKISGNNVGVNHGTTNQQNTTHTPNTDALQRENELLKAQLADKERTIQILLNQLPK